MVNYVFVVCNPRSGSTLTRNILSQWEDVAVSPELGFLYRIASQRKKFQPLDSSSNREALIQRLFSKFRKFNVFESYRNLTSESDVDPDSMEGRLRDLLADQSTRTFKRIYQWVIEELSVGNGSTYLVKKPVNLYMVPLILRWFPNAKILGLVRDARDAVVSMTKGSRQGLSALWKAPCLWSYNARRLLQFQEQLSGNQLHIQRFEDLIQRPERTLRNTCEFLELPFDSDRVQNPVHVNSSFEGETQGFNTDVIGRFRNRLSPRELSLVEGICRKEMKHFGYSMTSETTHSGVISRFQNFKNRIRKNYMIGKERLRAFFKNRGRYHWLTPIFST